MVKSRLGNQYLGPFLKTLLLSVDACHWVELELSVLELKMVQAGREAGGTHAAEQSLLLSKSRDANGQSRTSVSIEEVASEYGTTIFKNRDDEESRGSGEAEEAGFGKSSAVRIIGVLLIGSCLPPHRRRVRYRQEFKFRSANAHRDFRCQRRRLHPHGHTPRHCLRVQQLGELDLVDHGLYPGRGSHASPGN